MPALAIAEFQRSGMIGRSLIIRGKDEDSAGKLGVCDGMDTRI